MYPTAATDLKRMLPCVRRRIDEMWSSVTNTYETETQTVGRIIRDAGIARSGTPRGDAARGADILNAWRIDLPSCRTSVSQTDVMKLLLNIKGVLCLLLPHLSSPLIS